MARAVAKDDVVSELLDDVEPRASTASQERGKDNVYAHDRQIVTDALTV